MGRERARERRYAGHCLLWGQSHRVTAAAVPTEGPATVRADGDVFPRLSWTLGRAELAARIPCRPL